MTPPLTLPRHFHSASLDQTLQRQTSMPAFLPAQLSSGLFRPLASSLSDTITVLSIHARLSLVSPDREGYRVRHPSEAKRLLY